jgi:hypothetical protein
MPTLLRTLLTTGATALLLVAGAAVPSARADEPAAQLSITLTNSEKTVKAGDEVTYTGRVKNLGASEAAVRIVLETPGYVELGTADGATIDENTATWTPTIAPGTETTFTIPAKVGKIPSTERRVTTLASVYAGEGTTPIVRTADAGFIDGVTDTPGGKEAPADAGKNAPVALPWIVVGVVVLVLLAGAAALLLIVRGRRRRRRRGGSV